MNPRDMVGAGEPYSSPGAFDSKSVKRYSSNFHAPMLNHESEAVVLRQYPLSEADRIVVFFTREYGKVRAVAQGAKRLKSRMGGCLEPLNHIHLRFYLKEGGDLARVRQCETIYSYLGRSTTLDRVYAFSYLAELVQELSQDHYPNHHLFRLFLSVLKAGSERAP